MLFEERLEAAERRRKEGNELFQRKESADALGKYSMALSYMDQDFMFQLEVAFLPLLFPFCKLWEELKPPRGMDSNSQQGICQRHVLLVISTTMPSWIL